MLTDGVIVLTEDQARPLGLWDEGMGTVRSPAPDDWLRCICNRRVRARDLWLVAGLGLSYPVPYACWGCIATMERQGDLIFSDAMELLGASVGQVARRRAFEAARPRTRFPRRKKRWER